MVCAQTLDYESIVGSKPLKVSGVVSANAVGYDSNQNNSRLPFTYFLQGTLNVSIYSFSIPISYSYSNQGDNFGYQLPFNFNRISLHPKYKWITGHIGNVTMSFSPYTLNGHQFTGGGLDLTPSNGFSFSAMGGRLLKATNDTNDPRTIPAFERMGYGAKAGVKRKRFAVGLIGFYAKDDITSIDSIPEKKGVLPQENTVMSVDGEFKINSEFSVKGEYATSAITKDTRVSENGIPNATVEHYKAYKTSLNYQVNRIALGVGFEHIDPGYKTLGAYFFNNDFENITLNASNGFFKDKLILTFDIGYQKDNLDNKKANSTNRAIGSFSANLFVNEKLNLAATYSNFSTYTNTKLNQFDIINDSDLTDQELEALDYKQLSQNATVTANYAVSNTEKLRKNITANYALNTTASKQGGVNTNDASHFHNINTSYSFDFIERDLSITPSINATYNVMGVIQSTTWGPIISLNKKYFEKTLQTSYAVSYSKSNSISSKTDITNVRASLQYVLKKQHNFNFSVIQLFRKTTAKSPLQETTATLGYSYSFGEKKPSLSIPKRKPKIQSDTIVVAYKQYYFEGEPTELTPKIVRIIKNGSFQYLTQKKKEELQEIEKQLIATQDKDKRVYKSVAELYLKSLSDYKDFNDQYNVLLFQSYNKLLFEAENVNSKLKAEHLNLHAKINSTTNPNPLDLKHVEVVDKKYYAHKKMITALKSWDLDLKKVEDAQGDFKIIKDQYKLKAFEMAEAGTPENEIIEYLEIRIADYYHKVIKEQ